MLKFITHKIEQQKKNETKDIFPVKMLGKKKMHFQVKNEKKEKEKVQDKNKIKFVVSSSEKGHWSWEEHKRFVEAIAEYGIQWEKVKYAVKTRTDIQIRSHAQKFYKKLKNYRNEQLGIDFTSDTIHNIKDMITHVRSVNDDYDLVKIFLYFPKLCEMQTRNVDLEEDVNINIFENLLNYNKKDIFLKDNNETSNINNRIDENKNENNNNNYETLYINYINTIKYKLDLTIMSYISNQIIINKGLNLLLNNYLKYLNNIRINKLN